MKKQLAILIAMALPAATNAITPSCQAAVSLVNGGFEATPFNPAYPADYAPIPGPGVLPGHPGYSSLDGWDITGTNPQVDLLDHYYGHAGADGLDQYIDMLGTAGGNPTYLSQQPTGLVAGQQYTISFAYSRNPQLGSASGELRLVGGANNESVSFTHNAPIGGANGLNWLYETLTFTALDTDLKLRFQSTSPGEGFAGFFLDDVTITATPEPATIVIWGALALVGAGVIRRRKLA